MKNIVVFGSFVVDLMTRSEVLPKRGETVLGSMFKLGAGGKGFNQCVAAHKAGANVTMLTKIGKDEFGKVALNTMSELNMNTDYILQSDDLQTGCALILVEEETSQNEIVVVPGACGCVNDEDIMHFKKVINDAEIILTQLETNLDATTKIIKYAFDNNVKVILNPAPAQQIPDNILSMIHTITPNETEAEKITGVPIDGVESMKKAAAFFLERGVQNVLITLGSDGTFVHDGDTFKVIPALKVDALDTTGAGDAFNGGFVTAISESKNIWEAVSFATHLAALSVQKMGTTPSMPLRSEIDESIIKNQSKGS